jgi:hypothetical protein
LTPLRCDQFTNEQYPAGIYSWADKPMSIERRMNPTPSAIFVVPGMYVGCQTQYGNLANTLECFYDASCLNTMASLISSLPPSKWPKPLNRSRLIKFLPNNTIGELYDSQMIEKTMSNIDFDGYYHSCAPLECAYSYSKYNSVIYLFTLVIGLYGGLSMILYFCVPVLITCAEYLHGICQPKSKEVTSKNGGAHNEDTLEDVETLQLKQDRQQATLTRKSK